MAAGRTLRLGLQLLDRQLLDRDGRPCGKVDDVELAVGDDGTPVVTALRSGPGVLARRLGWRWGDWLERAHRRLAGGEGEEPSRIPMGWVANIGAAIRLNVDAARLGNQDTERWARIHVVGRVPGEDHAPE